MWHPSDSFRPTIQFGRTACELSNEKRAPQNIQNMSGRVQPLRGPKFKIKVPRYDSFGNNVLLSNRRSDM